MKWVQPYKDIAESEDQRYWICQNIGGGWEAWYYVLGCYALDDGERLAHHLPNKKEAKAVCEQHAKGLLQEL